MNPKYTTNYWGWNLSCVGNSNLNFLWCSVANLSPSSAPAEKLLLCDERFASSESVHAIHLSFLGSWYIFEASCFPLVLESDPAPVSRAGLLTLGCQHWLPPPHSAWLLSTCSSCLCFPQVTLGRVALHCYYCYYFFWVIKVVFIQCRNGGTIHIFTYVYIYLCHIYIKMYIFYKHMKLVLKHGSWFLNFVPCIF